MVVSAIIASSTLSSSSLLILLFYTDPGAGALLWQLLLATLVGGAFYARLLIRKIKARIGGVKNAGAAYQVPLNGGVDPGPSNK